MFCKPQIFFNKKDGEKANKEYTKYQKNKKRQQLNRID